MDIKSFEKSKFVTILNNQELNFSDLNISLYGYDHPQHFDEPCYNESGFSLHLIVKGSILFSTENQNIKLSKNSCFILLPNKNSSYLVKKGTSPAHYWVTFSGKEATTWLKLIGFNRNSSYIQLDPNSAKQIRSCFFEIFKNPESNINPSVFFYKTLFNIFDIIHKFSIPDSTFTKEKRNTLIDLTIDYISQHFTEESCTIKTIAASLFVHPNYLSSLFTKATNTTLKEYINEKRILFAVSLIRNGATSISQIATQVGIPDASYFTKVFKKYNTITPTEEIKKVKNSFELSNKK